MGDVLTRTISSLGRGLLTVLLLLDALLLALEVEHGRVAWWLPETVKVPETAAVAVAPLRVETQRWLLLLL